MRLTKNIKVLAALALTATMVVGCGNTTKNPEKTNTGKTETTSKKKIYTSFYPIYDFTKKIVGDKMDVVNLVPAGTEPHDYELTVDDRKNLEKADAIIYNGAGMEEWVDDVKDAMKDKKVPFINTSEGITLAEGHHHHEDGDEKHHEDGKDEKQKEAKEEHHHDGDEHTYDPHIWLYPLNAKKQLENIEKAVINIDPENKAYYEENYKKYAEEFDKLDKEYAEKLDPYKDKTIIVSHEAFGYMCKAYGINQKGIEGLSPDTEPSPKKMAEIVDYVKNNGVKVIFFEELVSPKVAEAIAKETGAKTNMLNPLEGLSNDELKAGKDYVKVMQENLQSIVDALK